MFAGKDCLEGDHLNKIAFLTWILYYNSITNTFNEISLWTILTVTKRTVAMDIINALLRSSCKTSERKYLIKKLVGSMEIVSWNLKTLQFLNDD